MKYVLISINTNIQTCNGHFLMELALISQLGGKCGPVELLGQQAATAILTLNSALTATNWLHFVGPTPSTQGRGY